MSFAASIALRSCGAALSLGINVLFARLLGVEEYGRYMSVLSGAVVLSGIAVRGTDRLLTREISSRGASTTAQRRDFRGWLTRRIAIGIAVSMVIFVIWVRLRSSPGDLATWWYVGAGLLVILFLSVCNVLAGALNGYALSTRSQSLVWVIRNVAVMMLIPILASAPALAGQRGGAAALFFQAAGFLVAALCAIYWLRKRWGGSELGHTPEGFVQNRPDRKKAWASSARSFMLVAVSAILVNRIDVVLVSALAGDKTAGIYAAGSRLAQIGLMVALSINVVLNPRISTSWANDDYERVRRLLRAGFLLTIPIAIVEIIVAWAIARDAVVVFGAAYARSAWVFVWVTAAYALWSVAGPAYAFLAMSGAERIVAVLSWVILGANVAAILLLVPRFGAPGGAIAMTAGYGLTLPAVLVTMRRRLRKYEVAYAMSR